MHIKCRQTISTFYAKDRNSARSSLNHRYLVFELISLSAKLEKSQIARHADAQTAGWRCSRHRSRMSAEPKQRFREFFAAVYTRYGYHWALTGAVAVLGY